MAEVMVPGERTLNQRQAKWSTFESRNFSFVFGRLFYAIVIFDQKEQLQHGEQ
jgi:hypothetical protein